MEDKKLVVPAPVGASGDDVTTWALPEGAIARLGPGIVEALAFSSDGNYLAIGTRVGLWLYELETMSPVALWDTERGMVSKVAFSPDGKWIATGNWDEVLKVWDFEHSLCVAQMELGFWDSCVFSPDNRWLATSDKATATINLWNPESGELLKKFTNESKKGGRSMPIAFSPDTRLLASASREDTDSDVEFITVWGIETGEQIAHFTGHTGPIHSLCFSPCGRFLASGGEEDGTVSVWNVANWQQITAYTGYGTSRMVPSYSPEGVLRATAISYTDVSEDNAVITVWDLEGSEKLYATDEENIGMYGTVHFSNGSRLAHQSENGSIKVWKFGYPHASKSDLQPISICNSVAFSSDGKILVAEYRKAGRTYTHGDVLLWDLTSKRPSRSIETEPFGVQQFSYTAFDGKLYVASLDSDTVRLWKIGDNQVIIAEFTEHEKRWVRAALAPQVDQLACLDKEGTLIVWNLESMKKICQFTHLHERFPDAEMATLEFSPDGKLLLSETDHWPSARLWDVERNEEIREFPSDEIGGISDEIGGIMGLWDYKGFSPCGSYLACTEARIEERSINEGICLWGVKQKEILMASPFRDAWRCAYSPCSSYLAWAGDPEEGLLLWDLKRREIHRRIPLPEGGQTAHSLTFSSCAEYLAHGSHYGPGLEKAPICLWEVETGKHIATFCGHPTDVQGLAFSPNNELLASASFDGSILLWDLTAYL